MQTLPEQPFPGHPSVEFPEGRALVSLVGGVTTYFALVLATKLPLALWAGRLLDRK